MGLMSSMVLLMAALAAQVSVMATADGGSERFDGELYGSDLVLQADASDVRCTAHLVRVVEDMGQGALRCSDGRTGHFHWKMDDQGRGEAYGSLDGKSLTLIFG